MLYLAVRYDVQALVEEDLITCACPAVYYLLGLLVWFGVRLLPLCSVDGVVSSLTVDAIHSTLSKAAVDAVGPAAAVDIVVALVVVGVGAFIVRTAPEAVVVPGVPVDVVRAIVSL